MNDGTSNESASKGDFSEHLDRIWRELKEITRQVESETRRGGQIAKLRYDIRGLRQDLSARTARLGQLVYDAQLGRRRRPALASIDGYDDAIAAIDATRAAIAVKQQRIADLGGQVGREADAA